MDLLTDSIVLTSHVFPKYFEEAKAVSPVADFLKRDDHLTLSLQGVLYNVITYDKFQDRYFLRLHVIGMPDRYQSVRNMLDLDNGYIDIFLAKDVGLVEIDVGEAMNDLSYQIGDANSDELLGPMRFNYDDVGVSKAMYCYRSLDFSPSSAIEEVRYYYRKTDV